MWLWAFAFFFAQAEWLESLITMWRWASSSPFIPHWAPSHHAQTRCSPSQTLMQLAATARKVNSWNVDRLYGSSSSVAANITNRTGWHSTKSSNYPNADVAGGRPWRVTCWRRRRRRTRAGAGGRRTEGGDSCSGVDHEVSGVTCEVGDG